MNIIYLENCNKAINFDKIYTIEVDKENELRDNSKYEVRAYYESNEHRGLKGKTGHYEVLMNNFELPEQAEDYIKLFIKKYLDDTEVFRR